MPENVLLDFLFFFFSCGALFSVTRIVLKVLDRKKLVSSPDPVALDARLGRIEQIVESTALEVERLGEASRFTAELLAGKTPAKLKEPGRVVTPH